MGVQRGAPYNRLFKNVKYTLYKEYDALFGEKEQNKDIEKLKEDGYLVKKVHIKKGQRDIERSTYIKKIGGK
jgi:hypothetical protein